MASCLWTLWLCRNHLVFNNKRTKVDENIYLVKWRALKWCEATNICKESSNCAILFHYPQNSLSSNYESMHRSLLDDPSKDIFIFIDGAFVRDSFNSRKVGIGGFFKDKEEKKLDCFMEPHWHLVRSMQN